MFKLADRVKQTSITSGSGLYINFQSTFVSFTSFATAIANGNSTYYAIENNANFEIGIGSYDAAGDRLSRDTILASTNNSQRISLDGVSTIFCDYPAIKSAFLNSAGHITAMLPQYSGVLFPDSSIQTTAYVPAAYRVLYQNESLSIEDNIIFVNCGSGNITISLPTAIANGGRELSIKKLGNNTLTISPINAQTIDGQGYYTVHYDNQALSLISDNMNWFVF